MWVSNSSVEILEDEWIVPYYKTIIDMKKSISNSNLKYVRLKELCHISSGLYVRNYIDSGTHFLRVDNIRPFLIQLNDDDVVYVDESNVPDRCKVREGDVIISRTGTLGKASVCPKQLDGSVLSQHLTKLVPKDERITSAYLATFLNSPIGKSQLIGLAFGSTRLELTHDRIGKVWVPIVSKKDQKSAEKKLTTAIEAYYQAHSEICNSINELNLYFSEIFKAEYQTSYDALLSDDNWCVRKYQPRSVIPMLKITDEFQVANLEDIAEISRGKGTRSSDFSETGIPFVRTSTLMNHGIDPFPDHYASTDVVEKYKQPMASQHILYSIEGKVGEVAILTKAENCVIKNHVEWVRAIDEKDAIWIFLCLTSIIGRTQAKMHLVVQATIPGISSKLRKFMIPMNSKKQSTFNAFRQELVDRVKSSLEKRNMAINTLRELMAA